MAQWWNADTPDLGSGSLIGVWVQIPLALPSFVLIGSWCNGSTRGFDPLGVGSIPTEPTKCLYKGW